MQEFYVGDIVTPKEAYKFSGFLLQVTKKSKVETLCDSEYQYKLLPYEQNSTPGIIDFLWEATWLANQLNLVVSSKNLLFKVLTSDVYNEFNLTTEDLKISDDLCTLEVKEEKEMIDCEKILNLYKTRKLKSINEKYSEEKQKIIQEDAFYELSESYEKQFLELFKNEFKGEYIGNYSLPLAYTVETKQKIKEIEAKQITEKNDLHEKIKEVQTRLSIVDDYDEAVKILKKYDILDREGKINA